MQKVKSFILFFILLLCIAATGCNKSNQKNAADDPRLKEVIVYTYDSFAGEWGPGPELTKLFEEKTGYKLTMVDCGDAVQAYNRAVLEKDNVQADVIIGIDNTLSDNARKSGILTAYTPKDADKIISKELFKAVGNDKLLTPYDFSHFTVIWNSASGIEKPASLQDLTKEIYRNKIILMDPRTSTPGRLFLAWTVARFGTGKEFTDYWKALKPNVLTMTSGWSEGWGMYQKDEAPLVISYTTSPAYNVEYENNYRDVALVFDEGHVEQVEAFGLLKNAPNEKGAKAFMDFLISAEGQITLPLTQWMYPVNSSISLPKSYSEAAPVPAKTLPLDAAATDSAVNTVIKILSE